MAEIKGVYEGLKISIKNNSTSAIPAYRLLTFSAGKIALAATNSTSIIGVSGFNEIDSNDGSTPVDKFVPVVLNGVVYITASTDISYGAEVYADDEGKVSTTGTLLVGYALDDAETDEVIPVLLI